MEIRVNEYVRTDCGTIIKVKKIEEDEETKDIWYYEGFCLGAWKSRVVKHSPNIIDLIEEGDYVNGCRVYEVNESGIMVYQNVGDIDIDVDYSWISKRRIKTIVTKEQFNSIKYVIGE